jgi:hypothetical protein
VTELVTVRQRSARIRFTTNKLCLPHEFLCAQNLSCPQLPSIALDFPKIVISLPWVAVSLVTELVTVALGCPGLPLPVRGVKAK